MFIEKDFGGEYLNISDLDKVLEEESWLLSIICSSRDSNLIKTIIKNFFELMPEIKILFKNKPAEKYYDLFLKGEYKELANIGLPWPYIYNPGVKHVHDYLHYMKMFGICDWGRAYFISKQVLFDIFLLLPTYFAKRSGLDVKPNSTTEKVFDDLVSHSDLLGEMSVQGTKQLHLTAKIVLSKESSAEPICE